MLQAGDEAPDFSLESDEGDTVTLSALRGRPVVFYFYPKDDTPGCTTQASLAARQLRRPPRERRGASTASRPTTPSRTAPSARSSTLPFPLLVDTDHEIAEVYGAWGERPNGKMGIVRSLFVVGPDGRILRASYNVTPEDTTPEALAALSV